MYIVKITVDNYSEFYKFKNIVSKFSINIKKRRIKFKYNNLIELFSKLLEYNIKYKKINVLNKGDGTICK